MNVILDFRLHSRARRLTFSSGDLRPVWSPCFFYPPSLLFTALPHASAQLCSSFWTRGRALLGQAAALRIGRGEGMAGWGRRLLQRATSSSRSASLPCLPACCPAEMAHGFACGARTTARHGPRVAHRVTRHRAVLLARGPPRVASAFPVGGARRPLVASQSGRGAAGQARACVIRLVLVPRPARGGTGRWPAPRARALWIRLAGCSRLSCYRCDAPGAVWWGWTCLGLG